MATKQSMGGSTVRVDLQPGHLSKPEKVWCTSSTLIIGFYQAAPYSEMFKVFYKKSGAVFGTQVTLTPQSILGPELAVKPPVNGEATYFEYEIKKLKPSTQYIIKIKTHDDSCEVRSDKMGTVSLEEERARNNDMQNFKGALVKLGEYDGLVASYAQETGIFQIRILQVDDLAQATQLARLTSDYSDSGLPVQAYTLSQVRFGRWGGEITASKVVNEGELKWLVARAVQVADKSDAHAAYEARARLLQSQVDKVTGALEAEWSSRLRALKLRSILFFVLAVVLAVGASAGMWLTLSGNARRLRHLEALLAGSSSRVSELEAELSAMHLYRVSMELDMGRVMVAEAEREAAGARGNGTAAAEQEGGVVGRGRAAAASGGSSSSSGGSSRGGGKGGEAGGGQGGRRGAGSSGGGSSSGDGQRRADGGKPPPSGGRRREADGGAQAARAASDKGTAGWQARAGAAAAATGHTLPLSDEAIQRALLRSHQPGNTKWGFGEPVDGAAWQPPDAAQLGGGGGPNALPAVSDEAPDAWAFIHYVSNLYAMHLQEWMKLQLGKAVRHKVDEMLASPATIATGPVNDTTAGSGAAAPPPPAPAARRSRRQHRAGGGPVDARGDGECVGPNGEALGGCDPGDDDYGALYYDDGMYD